MPSASSPAIVLVGAGPRGVSLLERIGANLPESPDPLVVHVIDDTELGAGRIWRTDQSRELCMNTLANAVTLFTDESVTMAGPVVAGPTLYEWCLLVHDRAVRSSASAAAIGTISPERVAAFDGTPLRPGLADDYRDELAAMRPQSHPSRSLYGEYSRWCYARARQRMPRAVELVEHVARATSIAERDERQVVTLQGGTLQDTIEIVADAVVVAAGWMPRAETAEERELRAAITAHPGLVWVRPDSPVDQDVDAVPDGAVAIVRGLGMGFFDVMALLSVGRGGRFLEDPRTPGGLRYEPSGREPVLHVTSHRGVPYRAKTLYGSLPPRAPQRHLRDVAWDAIPRPIDFDAQVWPLVLKDAFTDYYETLHRVKPDAVAGRLVDLLEAIGAADGMIDALTAAVAPFVPDPADRFDLAAAMQPVRQVFDSPAAFDAWVLSYVADDLAEAERGRDSALKAGLWSISSARQPTGIIGSFGGFDAESRAQGFRTLHSFGGMVGSGPPAFRNRQLLALARAGLVHFIGPRAHVTASRGVFHACSPTIRGSEVEARVLVDAWMHFHDISASADPLTESLLAAGRARAFAVPTRDGAQAPTGGFDIDPSTGLLVHPDGSLDVAVHVAGIPVDEVMHDTIISPMPGTDPTMLRETDRVARSVLRIVNEARERRAASERTTT